MWEAGGERRAAPIAGPLVARQTARPQTGGQQGTTSVGRARAARARSNADGGRAGARSATRRAPGAWRDAVEAKGQKLVGREASWGHGDGENEGAEAGAAALLT